MDLFSAVFCLVTVVHKFGFRLVINEKPDKWRPVAKGLTAIQTHVFFPLNVVASEKGLYPRSASHMHSLEEKYLNCLRKREGLGGYAQTLSDKPANRKRKTIKICVANYADTF